MCVNKDTDTGIVMFISLRKVTGMNCFLKLKGLIKDAVYEIDGEEYSGDYLMNVGINLSYFIEQNNTKLFVLTKK